MAESLGAVLIHCKVASVRALLRKLLRHISSHEAKTEQLSQSVIRLSMLLQHLIVTTRNLLLESETRCTIDHFSSKGEALSTLTISPQEEDAVQQLLCVLHRAQAFVDEFFVHRVHVGLLDALPPPVAREPEIFDLMHDFVHQRTSKTHEHATTTETCVAAEESANGTLGKSSENYPRKGTGIQVSSCLRVKQASFSEILRENKKMAVMVGRALRLSDKGFVRQHRNFLHV